jgi:hypothetical protein
VSRRKQQGMPRPLQLLLAGSVLMLRVWLAVIDQAPPVPLWFVTVAAVLFGGSLGWLYHAQVVRWRSWKARWLR